MAKRKSAGSKADISDICARMPASEQHELRALLARLLDKWSLWVLAELCSDGPLRFSRLLERLQGVSQKSLTATLRSLERDGLVTRTVVVQVPIRVDYAATELAKILVQEVQPICCGESQTCLHLKKTAANSIQMQSSQTCKQVRPHKCRSGQ